jgi:hypothetical protein
MNAQGYFIGAVVLFVLVLLVYLKRKDTGAIASIRPDPPGEK